MRSPAVRLGVLVRQHLDVAAVLQQGLHGALQAGGRVDRVRRGRGAGDGHPAHAVPRRGPAPVSSGKIQRFPASPAASSVARPTARWSGVFQAPPPQVSRWLRVIDQLGPVAPDRRGDVAAQRGRRTRSHRPGGPGTPRWRRRRRPRSPAAPARAAGRTRRVDGVDARLAAAGEEVGDLASAVGPAGHGRGAAVLEVVGVGDHGQRALPVVGHGFQLLGHGRGIPAREGASELSAGESEQPVQHPRAARPHTVVLVLVGDPGTQSADRRGGAQRVLVSTYMSS